VIQTFTQLLEACGLIRSVKVARAVHMALPSMQ